MESVVDLTSMPFVYRELMLIKVRCTAQQRREITDVVDIFRAHVVDMSLGCMTLEVAGRESKVSADGGKQSPRDAMRAAERGMLAACWARGC